MPLSIRILAVGILMGLSLPRAALTQTPRLGWANVINALQAGVKPEVLRSTMRGERCISTEPTVDDYRQLNAALSQLNLPSDEQVDFIADLQCSWGPVQESVGNADVMDVSSPGEIRTSVAPLVIESEDLSDGVTVNGALVGRVPQRIELQPGLVYRIRIGQGPEAVDTTITPRGGGRTFSLRKTRLVVTTQGPPVPARGSLERELEEQGFLPFLPAIPPYPSPPLKPRGRSTFLLALLAGGGAFAASAGPCTSMATSPSPGGGVFSGTYYPPGSLVNDAKLVCSGATAGAAFLGTALLTSVVKRAAYRRSTASYNATVERLTEASRQRVEILRQREEIVDSALAVRRQLSSRRTVTVGLSGAERPMDASAFEVRPEPSFQGTRTSMQLRSTIAPSEVRWTSSDESLASVDEQGIVRFLRQGEVTIAGTYGGKTWQQEFDVWERLARGAVLSLPNMDAGEHFDYALLAAPGESYRIELQGRRMDEDADLYIFSPGMDPSSAEAVCSGTGTSSNERCVITIPANEAGLWRLRISTFSGPVRDLRIRIDP